MARDAPSWLLPKALATAAAYPGGTCGGELFADGQFALDVVDPARGLSDQLFALRRADELEVAKLGAGG